MTGCSSRSIRSTMRFSEPSILALTVPNCAVNSLRKEAPKSSIRLLFMMNPSRIVKQTSNDGPQILTSDTAVLFILPYLSLYQSKYFRCQASLAPRRQEIDWKEDCCNGAYVEIT